MHGAALGSTPCAWQQQSASMSPSSLPSYTCAPPTTKQVQMLWSQLPVMQHVIAHAAGAWHPNVDAWLHPLPGAPSAAAARSVFLQISRRLPLKLLHIHCCTDVRGAQERGGGRGRADAPGAGRQPAAAAGALRGLVRRAAARAGGAHGAHLVAHARLQRHALPDHARHRAHLRVHVLEARARAARHCCAPRCPLLSPVCWSSPEQQSLCMPADRLPHSVDQGYVGHGTRACCAAGYLICGQWLCAGMCRQTS